MHVCHFHVRTDIINNFKYNAYWSELNLYYVRVYEAIFADIGNNFLFTTFN